MNEATIWYRGVPIPYTSKASYMCIYIPRTINRIEASIIVSNNILSWLVLRDAVVLTRGLHTSGLYDCRRKRFSEYLKIYTIITYTYIIFYSCVSRAFVPKRPVNLFPIVFRVYLSTNALIFTRPDAVFNVISDKQPAGGSSLLAPTPSSIGASPSSIGAYI